MKKITLWGSYDNNNYDIRNLINGLKQINYEFIEINNNVWNEKDKSKLTKAALVFKIIILICCYPALLIKYLLGAKKNQITIISYPGWLDLFLLYPFAKIKRNKIYFFIFISLYDTIVLDRKIVKNKIFAKIIFLFEKISYNISDRIYVDTEAHKTYLKKLFLIKNEKIFVSYQSISKEFLEYKKNKKKNQILYFGKYIPLHGIAKIVSVINKCPKNIEWIFVGDGPDKIILNKFINENPTYQIRTIKWLNENELKKIINASKYILGIFGESKKTNNVIPLKIFMSLASKSLIITKKTRAISEINASNIIKIDNIEELPLILKRNNIKKKDDTKPIIDFSYISKAKNFIDNIE